MAALWRVTARAPAAADAATAAATARTTMLRSPNLGVVAVLCVPFISILLSRCRRGLPLALATGRAPLGLRGMPQCVGAPFRASARCDRLHSGCAEDCVDDLANEVRQRVADAVPARDVDVGSRTAELQ